ncbi:hypothetical protein OIU79_020324 [Salix purpurea]|uniref:Uncharacterized protein n=1 Tax=Salix purpurea TaxID=77065 RepID=A0A9Q0SKV6_SALPP|nr:hypothetical protein OIU79_020324 [Salix purpurea]
MPLILSFSHHKRASCRLQLNLRCPTIRILIHK